MPTAMLIVLGLVALAILGWLVFSVGRKKAFAPSDGIALLGLIITLLVAILPYALRDDPRPPAAAPTITITGPDVAPLGARTYFTLVSTNATRAEWTMPGFANGETFVISPLARVEQVFTEPTQPGVAGSTFSLVVTVYGADGQTAIATHEFRVTEP